MKQAERTACWVVVMRLCFVLDRSHRFGEHSQGWASLQGFSHSMLLRENFETWKFPQQDNCPTRFVQLGSVLSASFTTCERVVIGNANLNLIDTCRLVGLCNLT